MNITLMEKVYNGNEVALYVNGFVGAIAEDTFIDNVKEILHSLDYNITSTNHMIVMDDLPNNEKDLWHEGEKKAQVHLEESKWVHNCDKGCCFDTGYQLKVNGERFLSANPIGVEVVQILEKLGHTVSLNKNGKNTFYRPGDVFGYCLEYLNSPTDEELEAFDELLSSVYLQTS